MKLWLIRHGLTALGEAGKYQGRLDEGLSAAGRVQLLCAGWKPEHVYGSSTTEAIQAGLYYGTAGSIKEFCHLFKKNVFHGEDAVIIGTGGFARTFEDYNLFDEIIPGLVLTGVKKALELN